MFLLPRVLAGTHSKRSIKTSWFWWANHEASNCLFEGRQLITIWDNDGCGAIDRISEPVLHDLWVSPKLEGPDHVLQVNCNCSWTRQEVSHHRVKLGLTQTTVGRSVQFSSLQFTFSCNSLVHDQAHYAWNDGNQRT